MVILVLLASIWAFLMLRSCIAEYQYYQSVKTLEPETWAKLGSPKYLKIPIVFVSALHKQRLLKGLEAAIQVHKNRSQKIDESMKISILKYSCTMAIIDGELDNEEINVLHNISESLNLKDGYVQVVLKNLFDEINNSRNQ